MVDIAPLHTITSSDWLKKIGNIAPKPLERKEERPTLKPGCKLHYILHVNACQSHWDKQPTVSSASDHANELVWVAPRDGTLYQQHIRYLYARGWIRLFVILFTNYHLKIIYSNVIFYQQALLTTTSTILNYYLQYNNWQYIFSFYILV